LKGLGCGKAPLKGLGSGKGLRCGMYLEIYNLNPFEGFRLWEGPFEGFR